jgi:hypothetical protein
MKTLLEQNLANDTSNSKGKALEETTITKTHLLQHLD